MPPSASTILPTFSAKAPGKAPVTWPNSSLSMMLAATALQSSMSSGPLARRLAEWIARAKVSLPLPGSPMIRIGRRLRAALAATASADRNSGAAPTSCSSDSSGASFSDTGASSPAAWRRSALAASASSSRSGATGRTRKSDAPARIASTAMETHSPWRSTMTGRLPRCSSQRGDQLRDRAPRPSCRAGRPGLRGRAGPAGGRRRSRRRRRRPRSSRRARRWPRSAGARRRRHRPAAGIGCALRRMRQSFASVLARRGKGRLKSRQGAWASRIALLWTPGISRRVRTGD